MTAPEGTLNDRVAEQREILHSVFTSLGSENLNNYHSVSVFSGIRYWLLILVASYDSSAKLPRVPSRVYKAF